MKGKTIIELRDVYTNEVQRIEDNNMFTNALNDIINKSPWWSKSEMLAPTNYHSDVTKRSMTPLIGNALGGLLLFPETIEEDPSIVFAPATNKPTGIANMDAYTGDDSRRGSFNTIESVAIENGYRFVWDFPTSAGNGRIACAGLTSNWGGMGYWDAGVNLLKDSTKNNYWAPGANYELSLKDYRCRSIGSDDTGLYFHSTVDHNKVYKIETPKQTLKLLTSPMAPRFLGTLDRVGTSYVHNNEICVIQHRGNSSGVAVLEIDHYNIDTWNKETTTLSVAAPLKASHVEQHTCVSDGFLYLQGYDGTTVYKVELANPANVREIAGAFSSNINGQRASMAPFNGGVIGCCTLIEADGTAHSGFDLNANPLGAAGPIIVNMAIGASDNWQGRIAPTVITPYLATINNLPSPLSKSATQTMKVTYIVTE